MRIVLLMLLLVNAGFFAYHQFLGSTDEAATQIQLLQVSPDKITSVTAAVSPLTVASAPVANVPAAACIEWGSFGGPDMARADAALAALALPEPMQRRVTDIDGYWVHMAPLKNKAEIDRKIGELKSLEITEFFVVQDPGPWRNAISLGLYKSEDAANAELERLRNRGVRSAIVTRREKFLKQVTFFVREPGAASVARLTDLQREFPAAEIKATPCPVNIPEKK